MNGPFTLAMACEMLVAIAIILIAAAVTNLGAISAAIERLGWF